MTTETALVLPDETQFKADMQAINRFQSIVHANMIKDQDYGVIPGTGTKPTLLKPGAEKISKLLGLADTYEIVDRQEQWDEGFFRYLVRCTLTHINSGMVVSEGLGECNSMESKYRYRWAWPSEVPEGFDKVHAASKTITKKDGTKAKLYRVDNDDVYSQVNTIVKMAKKRALVDAALSAGRLSNVFTQDIEDLDVSHGNGEVVVEPPAPAPKPAAAAPAEQQPSLVEAAKAMGAVEQEKPVFKNIGELLTRAYQELDLSKSNVMRLLDVESLDDIKDMGGAWLVLQNSVNK